MSATTAITAAPAPYARAALRTWAEVLLAAPLLTLGAIGVWQGLLLVYTSLVLSQAAAAGAHEAALPRATRVTIEAAVDRALSTYAFAHRRGAIEIAINDWPAGESSLASAVRGDRVSVSVDMPAIAAVPDLLRCVGLSLAHDTLSASAQVSK